jgi:anti-sigma B factor antagonist
VSKLKVQGRNGTGDVLLVVVGSVDIATAPELERALARTLSEPAERLVIDLRRVDFMDASGVSLLLRQERRARAAGAALIVVKGPPAVQRLFQLTGLGERLLVVDEPPASSEAETLRPLRSG